LFKRRHRLALEVQVIDDGPGIPEDIRERMFYPLVSGRAGGSGLGLTLAQSFVQQHQGRLIVQAGPAIPVSRFACRWSEEAGRFLAYAEIL
jgi:two-component system nitrogen regulation sensor histidine kinase GlnL